jgi:TonB family protein
MLSKLAVCLLAGTLAYGATITGRVYDPSNAVVPNVQVILTNLNSRAEAKTATSPSGEYQFASLVPGKYELQILAPGFAYLRRANIVLQSDTVRTENFFLRMGEIQETIEVTGAGTPRAQSSSPKRVRVGGNMQVTKLLKMVRPVYPETAKSEGREGTVQLLAVILTDGTIGGLTATPDSDAELAQAAIDAVRQWQYQPTLLNGKPVEVATSIQVNFKLKQ